VPWSHVCYSWFGYHRSDVPCRGPTPPLGKAFRSLNQLIPQCCPSLIVCGLLGCVGVANIEIGVSLCFDQLIGTGLCVHGETCILERVDLGVNTNIAQGEQHRSSQKRCYPEVGVYRAIQHSGEPVRVSRGRLQPAHILGAAKSCESVQVSNLPEFRHESCLTGVLGVHGMMSRCMLLTHWLYG
jgi:hypothetical protein